MLDSREDASSCTGNSLRTGRTLCIPGVAHDYNRLKRSSLSRESPIIGQLAAQGRVNPVRGCFLPHGDNHHKCFPRSLGDCLVLHGFWGLVTTSCVISITQQKLSGSPPGLKFFFSWQFSDYCFVLVCSTIVDGQLCYAQGWAVLCHAWFTLTLALLQPSYWQRFIWRCNAWQSHIWNWASTQGSSVCALIVARIWERQDFLL